MRNNSSKWRIVIYILLLPLAFIIGTSLSKASENDAAPILVTQERLLEVGGKEFYGTYTKAVYNGSSDRDRYNVGGLYGLRDWLTVGVSVSEGDVSLLATTKIGNFLGMQIRPALGVSFPLDYDNVSPFAPVGDSSGTIDVTPSVSMVGNYGKVNTGLQWMGVFRTDENNDNFAYGDENTLTGWLSYDIKDNANVYLVSRYMDTGPISNLLRGPSTDSQVLQAGLGAKVTHFGLDFRGEFMFPVTEDVNSATQFNDVRRFSLGVQKTF